jgi:hypothetical protein
VRKSRRNTDHGPKRPSNRSRRSTLTSFNRADPTDDYYVLVGVTWARLRDFDPGPDPTRTVVNEKAYQTFASAMHEAFVLGFKAGRVNQ